MTFLLVKNFALASLAAAALVACGGGDGGSVQGTTGSTAPTVKGLATKGPLIGATVAAYEITASGRSQIGTATTENDGTFNLNLSKSTSNPICLEVTAKAGGIMLDDANPENEIILPEDLTMSSCAPAGSTEIGINPFTDLAAQSLGDDITNESIQRANAVAELIAGVDPLTANFEALQNNLQALYGDGSYCGENQNTLCGIEKLNNAFAQAASSYVKNGDTEALLAEVEKQNAESPVPVNTESDAFKNFGKVLDNDPRYGHGGKVLSSKNVVKEEVIEADSDYNVTPAGFFVFQVSNLNDFATGQYIKAAKIAKSSTDFGYAFGLDFFSASTTDGWKTSSWSYGNNGNHYGQAFLNGQLLTTCKAHPYQAAGSELQVIAFSEAAQVVKNLSELNGKTFTEYSCGVDSEDWYDFNNGNKTPFAYTSSFNIENGYVLGMDEGDEVNVKIPVANLFSGKLFTEKDDDDGSEWSSYATAYKLGGKYFIMMKDKDTSRKDNSSQYGLTLAVSN